jgi:F-type H+-transporting ATPase subunit c
MLLSSIGLVGASIGAGIIIWGAALGISKIGCSALEAMARQPEVSGKAQTTMIIAAALIEGVALFGILICLLIATK